MQCEQCGSTFSVREIRQKKMQLISYEIGCPQCDAILVPDRRSSLIRYSGFLLLLAGGVAQVLRAVYLNSDERGIYWLSITLLLTGVAMTGFGFRTLKLRVKTD